MRRVWPTSSEISPSEALSYEPPPLCPAVRCFHHTITDRASTVYRNEDRRRAAHVIWQQGFGAAKRDVDQAFNDGTATAATNHLIDDALAEAILRPEALVWYSVSNSTCVQEDYDIQHL